MVTALEAVAEGECAPAAEPVAQAGRERRHHDGGRELDDRDQRGAADPVAVEGPDQQRDPGRPLRHRERQVGQERPPDAGPADRGQRRTQRLVHREAAGCSRGGGSVTTTGAAARPRAATGRRPPSASSARAASRPAWTIRSSWWNSSSPTPSVGGRDDQRAPGAGGVHGAAAADHHRAQQGLAERRDPGSARSGAAAAPPPPIAMFTATTGPSSRSVSRSTGRLSSTPPSTSSRPSSSGDRREQHGQPDRGQRRVDQACRAGAPAGCG